MRGIDKSIVTRWTVNPYPWTTEGSKCAVTIHRWQMRSGNTKHTHILTAASLKRATTVDVARVMGVR